MKVLLKQCSTGRWFKNLDTWVGEKEQARDFGSSLTALDFCIQHKIKEVTIVLCFDDPRFDLHVHPFTSPESPAVTSVNPAMPDRPDAGGFEPLGAP